MTLRILKKKIMIWKKLDHLANFYQLRISEIKMIKTKNGLSRKKGGRGAVHTPNIF